jgi:LacI family transcriptional regulator
MISSLKLAKLCGVSQGTVDRALHNRPEIGAATRERILEAARRHGYRPNPQARELLSGKSKLVGGILPALNSIFFLDLFNEIKNELSAHGYRLFLTPVSNEAEFLECLDEFAARRFAAVIAVPPRDSIAIPKPVMHATKVITLLSPSRAHKTHFVSCDEVLTGREAVNYLFSLNHTQILHLKYARKAYGILARERGYVERMRELGLKPTVLVDPDAAALLDTIREKKCTAIFAHNDWLAVSTIRMLEENGLRVPADISVLGVDASPTFMQLYPNLTTLAYPFSQVARNTAALLLEIKVAAPALTFKIVKGGTVSRNSS